MSEIVELSSEQLAQMHSLRAHLEAYMDEPHALPVELIGTIFNQVWREHLAKSGQSSMTASPDSIQQEPIVSRDDGMPYILMRWGIHTAVLRPYEAINQGIRLQAVAEQAITEAAVMAFFAAGGNKGIQAGINLNSHIAKYRAQIIAESIAHVLSPESADNSESTAAEGTPGPENHGHNGVQKEANTDEERKG